MVNRLWSKLWVVVLLASCASKEPNPGQLTMREIAQQHPQKQAAQTFVPDSYAEALKAPSSEAAQFVILQVTMQEAYAANNLDEAEKQARKLIALIPRMPSHPDYGSAIFYVHQTLGKIALRRGDVKTSVQELYLSLNTPSSKRLRAEPIPMELPRALIDAGQRNAVSYYLERCSRINDAKDQLIDWGVAVRKGLNPDLVPYKTGCAQDPC